MDEIKIFNSKEFGKIRTIVIDNEPWFVGKDISEKLGYAQVANMSKLIDEDDKQIIPSSKLDEQVGKGYKQSYQITIINESGLYAAIFGSKQENAKKFKRWVTSEVLPTIRKTGSYHAPATTEGKIKLLAQGHIELRQEIETVKVNVTEVKSDLERFKEDCPLFPIEAEELSRVVRQKGIQCLGGKDAEAYHDRGLRMLIFQDIYGQLHRNFGCGSYKAIRRGDIEKAKKVVTTYILPVILEEKIGRANINNLNGD